MRRKIKGPAPEPFEWEKQVWHGVEVLVCRDGGWDGDTFGNEWWTGYAIYPGQESDEKAFVLCTDDGRGNGDLVADFDTVAQAVAYAEGRNK